MTENSNENSNNNSSSSKFGPLGLGDPDDTSLRKMEINLLIPQYRREIVKQEKCAKEIDDYQNCVVDKGLFMAPLTCRSEKFALHNCLEFWNDDDEMFLRAKKQYLQERSEYRRTGITKDNIAVVENYLEEKRKAEEENRLKEQNDQPS